MDNQKDQNNNTAVQPSKKETLYLPRFKSKPTPNLIVKNEFIKQEGRRRRLIIYPMIFVLFAVGYFISDYSYKLAIAETLKVTEEKTKEIGDSIFALANCNLNSDSYKDDPLLRVMDKQRPLLAKPYFSDDLELLSSQYTYLGREVYVRRMIKEDLGQMIIDARNAGHYLEVNSGYRSYELQSDWFESTQSQEIEGITAIPGSSEHQLGTAVDISSHRGEVATMDGYRWLASNAYKYGFYLTYPKERAEETGFEYEPWHWRYIGKDLARDYFEGEDLFNSGDELFLEGESGVYPHNFFGNYLGIYLYKDKENNKIILDNDIKKIYPITAIYRDFEKVIGGVDDLGLETKIDIRGIKINLFAKYIEKVDSYLIFVYEDVDGAGYEKDQISQALKTHCPAL